MKKNNLIFTTLLICLLLLAACKKDNLIVTYDANGGIGTMLTQEFERDVPQPLLPNAFYFDGYSFRGWNNAADGSGTKFANEQIVTLKSNMTLFAQWRTLSHTYFVIFNANGGSGKMEDQPFMEENAQELSANTFTRTGYIFTGWNTKADGTGIYYRDKSRVRLSANLALYAQWTNNIGGGTPCPGIPKISDIDGNTYNTVQIGSQCWMRENLKTTKYNTGEEISIILDNNAWYYASSGAMSYYNNDAINAAIYGALYNGFAVDAGKLCPNGWHIPSNDEWNTLANELGGANIAGYKMKTTYDWSPDQFDASNGNGSNESGFSAFPASYRDSWNFYGFGDYTCFWSSTNNGGFRSSRSLSANSRGLHDSSSNINYGHSVRCVKD